MSIATEIARLQSDSSAIASAIAAKGVTVPSGSGYDDYATLIASISGGGGSPLPYTPVEYIQTDGTAYIDSGVLSKTPMSFDLKVKLNTSISATEVIVGTGEADGNGNTLAGLYRSNANQGKIGYGIYYWYSSMLTPSDFSKTMEVSSYLLNGSCKMGYKADGDSTYTSVSNNRTRNINSSLSLYIFASNNSGTPIFNASSGTRLYHLRMFCGAVMPTIVFYGIPCLYNGAYGLWDMVTNSFFGNVAGSGAFSGPQ